MQSFFALFVLWSYLVIIVFGYSPQNIFHLLPLVDHLTEVWRHVKRLEQTIHVAGSSLILQTFKSFLRLNLFRRLRLLDFAVETNNLLVNIFDILTRLADRLFLCGTLISSQGQLYGKIFRVCTDVLSG
jgi:hypothetical protein